MLRIHHFGLARKDAEKGRVKQIDIVEHSPGADVGLAFRLRLLGRDRVLQLILLKPRDGFNPVGEVGPELADVLRAREATGHADHGDTFAGVIVLLVHVFRAFRFLWERASRWSRARSSAPVVPGEAGAFRSKNFASA